MVHPRKTTPSSTLDFAPKGAKMTENDWKKWLMKKNDFSKLEKKIKIKLFYGPPSKKHSFIEISLTSQTDKQREWQTNYIFINIDICGSLVWHLVVKRYTFLQY